MTFNPVFVAIKVEKPDWYEITARYAQRNIRKAILQLLDTFIPYFLLLILMAYTVRHGYSYWITLALAVAAAAILTRIFIFFHDCTHGSFFASPRWNRNLGYVCGILTFTAFHDCRRAHAAHHIRAGDLDRRGFGDIWTLTVEEYLTAPVLTRLGYRLYRNPFIMFGLGPGYYFLLRNRLPTKGAKKRDVYSIIFTNLAILAIAAAASLTIGFKTYVLVQLPTLLIAATIGVWLFYIQHQFEWVYWARHAEWDPMRAALEGASYYKLPKVLQWITGNIGIHHVHHVRPGIPNYHLQQCCNDIPALQSVRPLTIRNSLKSLRLNLWDEKRKKLVSFRSLKAVGQIQ
ncbi:MAG TPA: fatty acid desaturase [Geobacteraceae bacterium]|nr:fatty acid desaturase [Geobacteraceae bacterium]